MKQIVRTDKAPQPVGPYSQGIIAGDFIYVAGQGPTNPATGQRAGGGIAAETEQVLKNIQAILEGAGATPASLKRPESVPVVHSQYEARRSSAYHLAPLLALVSAAVLLGWRAPQFWSADNLLSIGVQSAVIRILAIGQTLVIIAGGID